jgi:hypothetical protein
MLTVSGFCSKPLTISKHLSNVFRERELEKEGVTAINNRKPLYRGLFICPRPESKTDELWRVFETAIRKDFTK